MAKNPKPQNSHQVPRLGSRQGPLPSSLRNYAALTLDQRTLKIWPAKYKFTSRYRIQKNEETVSWTRSKRLSKTVWFWREKKTELWRGAPSLQKKTNKQKASYCMEEKERWRKSPFCNHKLITGKAVTTTESYTPRRPTDTHSLSWCHSRGLVSH